MWPSWVFGSLGVAKLPPRCLLEPKRGLLEPKRGLTVSFGVTVFVVQVAELLATELDITKAHGLHGVVLDAF